MAGLGLVFSVGVSIYAVVQSNIKLRNIVNNN